MGIDSETGIGLRNSSIPSCIDIFSSSSTWTNMPAAETEFLADTGYHRSFFPFQNVNQIKMVIARVGGAGAAGAKIKLQYSLDNITFVDLISLDVATTGVKSSSWTNVPMVARTDVYLRLVGIDGDGVADPTFGNIILILK